MKGHAAGTYVVRLAVGAVDVDEGGGKSEVAMGRAVAGKAAAGLGARTFRNPARVAHMTLAARRSK